MRRKPNQPINQLVPVALASSAQDSTRQTKQGRHPSRRAVHSDNRSCAACRHSWQPDDTDLFCRRYPPSIRVDLKTSYVGVKAEWICGEFSQ